MRKIALGIILLMFLGSLLLPACSKKAPEKVDLKKPPPPAGQQAEPTK